MKTYKGTIENGERIVRVYDDVARRTYPLPLRLDLRNHSPDGFSWGYEESGPAQLALAIIADHTMTADHWATALPTPLYQEFKREVIAIIDQDKEWEMDGKAVSTWLNAKKKLQPPRTDGNRTYLVTWEIEIDAENAEAAARQARKYQLDPETSANVFKVFGEDCKDGEVVDLQALDEESEEGRQTR